MYSDHPVERVVRPVEKMERKRKIFNTYNELEDQPVTKTRSDFPKYKKKNEEDRNGFKHPLNREIDDGEKDSNGNGKSRFDFRKFLRKYEERELNGEDHPRASTSSLADLKYERDLERAKRFESRKLREYYSRPAELRKSIQSRVSVVRNKTIERDKKSSYMSLPVEKAKIRKDGEPFSVAYTVIQVLDEYIIGMVKHDMNGKVVPFLDLTNAHFFLKPEEKPQLLDEFIVNKMDNNDNVGLPWNLEDRSIEDFMTGCYILAGGKAISMTYVKNSAEYKTVPAIIFLVYNENSKKYSAKVLFFSGNMMIISCPSSNSNLPTSIKINTDRFRYVACWATLRAMPKGARIGETYVLPPGCILQSNDEPLSDPAWTVSKIEPLSKQGEFPLSTFLPGKFKCSKGNEQTFIDFYESFICTELFTLKEKEEDIAKETSTTTMPKILSKEISEVPYISLMLDFDDLSNEFISFWQKSATFVVSEDSGSAPFAEGIVTEVICHEDKDGMYEKFEIDAYIWPIGSTSLKKNSAFKEMLTGKIEACFTLDLNKKSFEEQFDFFKFHHFSNILFKKFDNPNLVILRLLTGFIEFEEKIKSVENFEDASSRLGADQIEILTRLLNPKNHVAILEVTSPSSDMPTFFIEYAKILFAQNLLRENSTLTGCSKIFFYFKNLLK